MIEIKSGAKRDGALTAWEFHNYHSGGSGIRSLYEVPGQVSVFHSVPAPLRDGSYRALASTANHFARESHMDELAHAVKLDPLEFRLKNLKDARLRAVLEAAATNIRLGTKERRPITESVSRPVPKKGATSPPVPRSRLTDRAAASRSSARRLLSNVAPSSTPTISKTRSKGRVVMGLGGALFEAIEYEDGRITNGRFSKYRVPRFRDTPQIDVILLDRKDLPSAGAGETPIVAIAPAIGNAIFDAAGVRLRSLPMVPHGLKT